MTARPLRVVLAEDDRAFAGALRALLARHGYDVVVARDGRAALDVLSDVAMRLSPRPDAVLLDVNMPKHTGLDLLTALRLARWDVPVILMSAFADASLTQKAHELGAHAVLAKPFRTQALLDALSSAVTRSSTSAGSVFGSVA